MHCFPLVAQIDSLAFAKGEYVTGEVNSMDRGVVTIDTDYSDSDFKIEWEKIQFIKTTSEFLILLSNGEQYIASLDTDSAGIVLINSRYNGQRRSTIEDIVYLRPVEKNFGERLNASIEFGTNLTKANRFRQYSSRLTSSYIGDTWSSNLQFSTLRSVQDDADTIRRTDGALNYNFFIPNNRFVNISITTLSNTEQKLDSRVNTKLGLGQYLIRTNSSYWSLRLGANRSFEQFSNEADSRASWEGYFGTELNLYDIGDFKIQSTATAFPGLTENGRWRVDFTVDAKYEFDFDLFFRVGATMNYDNQPAREAETLDYVVTTTLGWSW
ncbi:MAG: DUF481 domain-containing protein [Bacteroidota bacterium]